MRLINVVTLKFEQFFGEDVPKYAILSHTWGKDEEEISYLDILRGDIEKSGNGYTKFMGCCKKAQEDGIQYAWIDTCNIDKRDAVELGEAINSMYRWYKKASICYVYLSDVPGDDDPRKHGSKFRQSRWFRRGWTLQELLAPRHLRFYNSEWRCIGTKGDLCAIVGSITGVPRQFLLGITELRAASVAQRMSWAAKRETKRAEDLAYCLLGIFDVTMPMIYGEGGDHAFLRLQEQIMRTTRDDSILAWGHTTKEPPDDEPAQVVPGRILASGPSDFLESGQIVSREESSATLKPLDMSGGSLRIHLPLITTVSGRAIGLLSCGPENDAGYVVGIPLVKTTTTSDEHARPLGCPSVLQPITATSPPPKLIHIKNEMQSRSAAVDRKYWHYGDSFAEVNLDLIDVMPPSCWDKERALIVSAMESDSTHRTIARFRHRAAGGSQDIVILLELQEQGSFMEPRCWVMTCGRNTCMDEIVEKLGYLTQKVPRQKSASNGLLNLSVTLEPVPRQPIFIVRPELTPHPPDFTVDATAEMEKLDLMRELITILQEKGQSDAERDKFSLRVKDKSRHIEGLNREKELVEYEIRRLEARLLLLKEEAQNGAFDMHRLMAEQGEVEETQLRAANRWGQARRRWNELQHIEDGAYREHLDEVASHTPLLWAASGGHVDVVELILNKGAGAGLECSDGQTPSTCAPRNGNEAVIKLLSEGGGADIESKDDKGRTPLSLAAEAGNEAIVRLLLDHGADKESEDARGLTPLSLAVEHGHDTVVKMLLEDGAIDGRRPLVSETIKHDLDVVVPPRPEQSTAVLAARSAGSTTAWICGKCGNPLTGTFARALGKMFHVDCLCCRDCGASVAQKFFPQEDENGEGTYPLCETDYFRRLGLLCYNCGGALRGSYVSAFDHKYHIEHFTCHLCPTLFGSEDSYYEHDGEPYCIYHWSTQFAMTCHGCKTTIAKQFVQEGLDQIWHRECYDIFKAWNVRLDTLDDGALRMQKDLDRATYEKVRQHEEMVEKRMLRVLHVLSAFEESTTNCISNMNKLVETATSGDTILSAKRIFCHIKMLFQSIDRLESTIMKLGMEGLEYAFESRLLCKAVVTSFSLLSQSIGNGARDPAVAERLLNLTVRFTQYLRILIGRCIRHALQVRTGAENPDALYQFLDDLETESNTYDITGASGLALIRLHCCAVCKISIKDDCARCESERWHIACVKCSRCEKELGKSLDDARLSHSSRQIICDKCSHADESASPIEYVTTLQQYTFLLHVAVATFIGIVECRGVTDRNEDAILQSLFSDKRKSQASPPNKNRTFHPLKAWTKRFLSGPGSTSA